MHRSFLLPFFIALSASPIGAGCSGGGAAVGDPLEGGADGSAFADPPNEKDASSKETGPIAPLNGVYYGACLTRLSAGRIDRVLSFFVETSYTPAAFGGTLTMRLTPLKVANGLPPTVVSKTQTVGAPWTVAAATVDDMGVFAAPIGDATIPGAANPISGRDIVIQGVMIPGRFSASTAFCTQITGEVVQPTQIGLVGSEDTCHFYPSKEGGAAPSLSATDFAVGCSID